MVSPAWKQSSTTAIFQRQLRIGFDRGRVPAACTDGMFDGLVRYGAYGMVLVHGIPRRKAVDVVLAADVDPF